MGLKWIYARLASLTYGLGNKHVRALTRPPLMEDYA